MKTVNKKCACGLPLNDETECPRHPGVCIHCCDCPECECGCKEQDDEE